MLGESGGRGRGVLWEGWTNYIKRIRNSESIFGVCLVGRSVSDIVDLLAWMSLASKFRDFFMF